MNWALTGLGLLLVAEGLVWALAPGMIEDLLAAMRTLTPEQRRRFLENLTDPGPLRPRRKTRTRSQFWP